MSQALHLLILEDDSYDAELMIATLKEAGYTCQWERVETQAEFLAHLDMPGYDLILADYSLPTFDGLTALKLLRERDLDLPFLLVSGALGEEIAIESLKAGATDYVLKDRLSRLGPAVRRALRDKEEQRQRRRAEEALRESEERYRLLAENVTDVIWTMDATGRYTYFSPSVTRLRGYSVEEAMAQTVEEVLTPASLEVFMEAFADELAAEEVPKGPSRSRTLELELNCKDGSTVWAEARITALRGPDGQPVGILGVTRDITERQRAEEELRHSLAETARSQRTLLALSQAAQAVQRARTPDEVYHTVGYEVAELGYHAVILTLADDRAHLVVSHMTFESSMVRAVGKLIGIATQDYRFPLRPGGLFQRILAEGETIFTEQTAAYIAEALPNPVRPLASRMVTLLGLKQGIVAKLAVGGEAHGLLIVTGVGLTEADTPAVTAFANQAAIAIENAQLFEQVRAGRERLRRLTQQVVSAQEEERQRLSRELHDEAGQALTALKISLGLIQSDLPMAAGSLRHRLGEAVTLTETTMEQIRLLAQDLRPPALDTVGLNYTLEGLCRDFAERTQLSIDYVGTELPRLLEAADICLYRFLQEALTNVARHSCANQVRVVLRCDTEKVSLSVEDDGQGFGAQARMSMGIGLLGMQERLNLLGGLLEIESRPGQGAHLTAHIPLEKPSLERRKADDPCNSR